MKKFAIIAFAILCIGMTGFAQETKEFKPSGKPTFRIFTNFHSTIMDGETKNEFELNRAYLGYGYKFSEKWSGDLVFDVGNPEDGGKLEMTAYVKNAYLRYKSNGWTINFGLIGTTAFKFQETAWGYRYVAKAFQDQNKMGSSADLGISAAYKFSDILSADLILVNGEGYKNLESDSIFSVGLGLTLKPTDGFSLRAYYETATGESNYVDGATTVDLARHSTLAFAGRYSNDHFSIAAEYAGQTNNRKREGRDLSGFAAYGTVNVKSSKIFARYDNMTSNDDWNTSADGSRIVLGAEFNPVKGIKIAPNFQNFSPKADGVESVSYVYVNCEIKF
ncbi:hypothetical protein [Plebeiibacterium sediminum]|uniref:Porin n=1 Tax=Plebeiibacterium sediminum TaxID=2992112 RepID=A0AAE3M7R4_9BACT|nr:hypothetical protein [Plebeiobacterium sediminum]MCW3788541.1 hypothetical protein [Plebeiobacterium sediminum]